LFTEDMTIINLHIGVQKREGMVYYFNPTCHIFPLKMFKISNREKLYHT